MKLNGGIFANEAYRNVGKRNNFGDNYYYGRFSTPERAVYINPKTRDIKVAIRGTKTLKDLGTDVALAAGGLTKTGRFKRELEAVRNIRKAHPNSKITLDGHSLGSSLAREVGRKENLASTGFNGGYGIDSFFTRNPGKHTEVRTRFDPVSALAVLSGQKNVNNIDSKGLKQHSSQNFI